MKSPPGKALLLQPGLILTKQGGGHWDPILGHTHPEFSLQALWLSWDKARTRKPRPRSSRVSPGRWTFASLGSGLFCWLCAVCRRIRKSTEKAWHICSCLGCMSFALPRDGLRLNSPLSSSYAALPGLALENSRTENKAATFVFPEKEGSGENSPDSCALWLGELSKGFYMFHSRLCLDWVLRIYISILGLWCHWGSSDFPWLCGHLYLPAVKEIPKRTGVNVVQGHWKAGLLSLALFKGAAGVLKTKAAVFNQEHLTRDG